MTVGSPEVIVAAADDEELSYVISLAAAEFPGLVIDEPAVREVHRWSKNNFTIKVEGRIVGGYALLFLTADGVAAVLSGGFPMTKPPLHLLARCGEEADAAYAWMLVARKYGKIALPRLLGVVWERAPEADIYFQPFNAALMMKVSAGYGGTPLFERSPLWVIRQDNRGQEP